MPQWVQAKGPGVSCRVRVVRDTFARGVCFSGWCTVHSLHQEHSCPEHDCIHLDRMQKPANPAKSQNSLRYPVQLDALLGNCGLMRTCPFCFASPRNAGGSGRSKALAQ